MKEEKIQVDLFDGSFTGDAGVRPRRFKNYPRQRFLPVIKVPVEYTVISAIAVLMLLIISYAVGVEKGKTFRQREPARPGTQEKVYSEASVIREKVAPEELTYEGQAVEEEISSAEYGEDFPLAYEDNETHTPAAVEAEIKPLSEKTYDLRLASFKNADSAEAEKEKLKDKGYNAVMTKNGSWYQISIEGYGSIEEVKKAQEELSSEYKDSYIKRMNG
ncbi:MAG: SPOR domain-containing protein [Candidatus Omnitrophota bacterium]